MTRRSILLLIVGAVGILVAVLQATSTVSTPDGGYSCGSVVSSASPSTYYTSTEGIVASVSARSDCRDAIDSRRAKVALFGFVGGSFLWFGVGATTVPVRRRE